MANLASTDPGYWEGERRALPGIRSRDFFVGRLASEAARVTLLEMEPGFVIARHAHNTERFEVIVKGSLYLNDRVFHPGDVMTAHAHEFYGPKVAGPEGCTTAEVFADVQEGEALLFELADGSIVSFDAAVIGDPTKLARADWILSTRARVLAEKQAER